MADVIRWMLKAIGVTHLAHYLDDFILLGKVGISECQRRVKAKTKYLPGLSGGKY